MTEKGQFSPFDPLQLNVRSMTMIGQERRQERIANRMSGLRLETVERNHAQNGEFSP
jgi:hypothetical protein